MIKLHEGKTVEILLAEQTDCPDCITVSLAGQCTLTLTPHEARTLATELIMSVNRAEVRSSLQKSQNLRRSAEPGGGPLAQPSWAK